MDTAADRGPRDMSQGAFGAAPDSAGSDASPEAQAREASFIEPFERVFSTYKRMLSNYATLAVLDLRRAVVQFAWLVAGGILISVLIVTAWLAAVIALAVWLLGNGMSWPAVLLIAGALNLVGAAIVAVRLRGVFQHLPFETTLHQVKFDAPAARTKGNTGNAVAAGSEER